MHLDEAAEYLVDYIRKPRPSDGYPTFGYDFYLANVIASYMVEVEQCPDHPSTLRNSKRARELWPFFSEVAWDLCRRGIFRPGPRLIDGAMCGAAAESLLLAVAVAKSRDEDTTLKIYRGQHGRKKTIDAVVGQARAPVAGPFTVAPGCFRSGATTQLTAWHLKFPKWKPTKPSAGFFGLRSLSPTIGLS